jgi:hypothetical protein
MGNATKPQNVETDEALKEKVTDPDIDAKITGADTNNRTQFYTDFGLVNKVPKFRAFAL